MEITRLSTKGQIVLPKSIRSSRDWGPGTELSVEETEDGVLLRSVQRFAATELAQVAGCLPVRNIGRAPEQMRAAIDRQVKRRHDRGRY